MIEYRKEALNSLNDLPNQQVEFVLKHPFKKLPLIIYILIAIAIVFWLFFGSVSTREFGSGILLNEDSIIQDAVAQGSGLVTKVNVSLNQRVQAGDVLVTLRRSDLETQIKAVKEQLNNIKQEKARLDEQARHELSIEKKYLYELQQRLGKVIALQKKHIDDLEIAMPQRLEKVKKGVISKLQMEEQVRLYNNQIKSYNDNYNQLIRAKSQFAQSKNTWARRILDIKQEGIEKQSELNNLITKHDLSTQVRSPIDGMITSIKVSPGDYIKAGTHLVGLSRSADHLDAVMFFPATQGHAIEVGMKAMVIPAGVNKEEYGAIESEVVDVQPYPASRQTILSILQNEQLVDQILEPENSLIMVRLKLEKSNSSYSKLKWSSGEGPKQKIVSGLLATSQVISNRKAPITLVLPGLKSILGLQP